MRIRSILTVALPLALALLCGPAMATTQQWTAQYPTGPTGSTQLTNWGITPLVNLTFPKFDSTLGTLNSVTIKLDGYVTGLAGVENLSTSSGSTMNAKLQAAVSLMQPDNSTLIVEVDPASTWQTFDGGVWDGNTNYDGTSGHTFDSLSATASSTVVKTDAAYKSLFTGSGNIDLPTNAWGTSTANGGGTMSSTFVTAAGVTGTVTYDYSIDEGTPEPGTLAMLGMGLAVPAFRRRRKRA